MTMSRRAVRFFAIFAFVIAAAGLSAQSQTVRYIYDELGRLMAAIDQNGDAAVYQYDAVGNLLSIARHSTGSVKIFEFTPNGAPVGTTVTLYGIGFSATPSQNTVTFNGTTASVSASTTTSITVSVPSGSTTGTIGVTSPLGSATSGTSFQVTSAIATPTISSFTPTIGVIGTSVTVSGTNFETLLAHNRLGLNASRAVPTSGSATSLTTSVPIQRMALALVAVIRICTLTFGTVRRGTLTQMDTCQSRLLLSQWVPFMAVYLTASGRHRTAATLRPRLWSECSRVALGPWLG
jgi:YD repeat-containing protein